MSNVWKNNWQQGDSGHPALHNKIANRMRDQFDIRDYGASTANADNASAIQAAINDAAANGAWCYIAPGTYKTLSPLTTPAGLFGIHGTGIINYRGTGACALYLGDNNYVGLSSTRTIFVQDITIDGTGSTNATGIIARAWTRSAMERVKVKQCANDGINLRYCWINSLRDLIISDCNVGIRAIATGAIPADQAFNATWVIGGEIGAGCNYGAIIGDETLESAPSPTVGSGSGFFNVTIEGTKRGGLWIAEGTHINLISCYFERNGYVQNPVYPLDYERFALRIGTANLQPTNISLRDCFISGNINSDVTDVAYGVLVNKVNYLSIDTCSFVHGIAGRGVVGIRLASGSCNFVHMTKNYFNSAVDTPYDVSASDNYIIHDMRNFTGQYFGSGTLGHKFQAEQSYIADFADSDGDSQVIVNLAGTIQLRDQQTGTMRTIEIRNGVLQVVS